MEKRRKPFYFIPIIVLAVIFLLSGVVMLLWNAIIPDLLHLNTITYSQAMGLLILCRILFGSFRPGFARRGGPPWRSNFMNLTPEEKIRFRSEWQKRAPDKTHSE